MPLREFLRDTRRKMFCIAELWRTFFDAVGRENTEEGTFFLIDDMPYLRQNIPVNIRRGVVNGTNLEHYQNIAWLSGVFGNIFSYYSYYNIYHIEILSLPRSIKYSEESQKITG
ncbi:MAG: hypothetical protein AAGA80_13120 [Cyanobacteria bacterium P01_F01_bin.143]